MKYIIYLDNLKTKRTYENSESIGVGSNFKFHRM